MNGHLNEDTHRCIDGNCFYIYIQGAEDQVQRRLLKYLKPSCEVNRVDRFLLTIPTFKHVLNTSITFISGRSAPFAESVSEKRQLDPDNNNL